MATDILALLNEIQNAGGSGGIDQIAAQLAAARQLKASSQGHSYAPAGRSGQVPNFGQFLTDAQNGRTADSQIAQLEPVQAQMARDMTSRARTGVDAGIARLTADQDPSAGQLDSVDGEPAVPLAGGFHNAIGESQNLHAALDYADPFQAQSAVAKALLGKKDSAQAEADRLQKQAQLDADRRADNEFQRQNLAATVARTNEDRAARLAMAAEAARAKVEAAGAAQKDKDEQAKVKDQLAYGPSSAGLDTLVQSLQALRDHPGLGGIVGKRGMVPNSPLTSMPSTRAAAAKFDEIKSKLVIDTMKQLKEASATGSTGFGQLSNQEGERLLNYIAGLNPSMELPDFKKAVQEAIVQVKKSKAQLWAKANRQQITQFGTTANGNLVFKTADGETYNAD